VLISDLRLVTTEVAPSEDVRKGLRDSDVDVIHGTVNVESVHRIDVHVRDGPVEVGTNHCGYHQIVSRHWSEAHRNSGLVTCVVLVSV